MGAPSKSSVIRQAAALERARPNLDLRCEENAVQKDYLHQLGHAIDSGIGLSIKIDKFRVFINKTLLTVINIECLSIRAYQ